MFPEELKRVWANRAAEACFEILEIPNYEIISVLGFVSDMLNKYEKTEIRRTLDTLSYEEVTEVYQDTFNLLVDRLYEKARELGYDSFDDILYTDLEGPLKDYKFSSNS